MPLTVKNDALIVTGGKLAENCVCCCDCTPKNISYGRTPEWNESATRCLVVNCTGTGQCIGESTSGYLEGPIVCCACAETKVPKVRVNSGILDNSGNIGGVDFPLPPGCPAAVSAGSPGIVTDAELQADGFPEATPGKCRMRVAYTANNGPGGGPYGITAASLTFFFQTPENPLP
jgi:hypothetical protein